ncbi:MAG: Stp1/IreP family PP2C-type Ser/Thr phosphatase [Bacteriovorax sp.]|nr:Stp1/IreP family PP2C-type Ser/Thr phosphatase [Bacteriovorax sp.]
MGLIASGITDIGKKRKTNQDSFYTNLNNRLFIVADGMGGHNGGDIASQMVVKFLPELIAAKAELEPSQQLVESIQQMNQQIKRFGETNADLEGMGTTIVLLYFKGQNIYIGNVGDSRAYLINNQKIFQLSRDHSLVQEKLNLGIYNREQAAYDPQKNVLVRTVGFEDQVDVDVFVYKVNKGDIFLCCSDGLHGKVSDEDILFLVNKYLPDPVLATQELCDKLIQRLIDEANDNGGQDNITAILVTAQ